MPKHAILRTSFCYYCNDEVWFHKYLTEVDGKFIPLDFERDSAGYIKRHDCIEKQIAKQKFMNIKCYNCNRPITFHKKMISRNGKKIPCEINMITRKLIPHDCSKNYDYEWSLKYRDSQITPIYDDNISCINIPKVFEDMENKTRLEEQKFREQWK